MRGMEALGGMRRCGGGGRLLEDMQKEPYPAAAAAPVGEDKDGKGQEKNNFKATSNSSGQ